MYTYGFPGRLADVSAPEATFVEGVVGRITTLDGPPATRSSPADPALGVHLGRHLGQPDLQRAGHVVAVNTGGYGSVRQPGKPAHRRIS